MGSGSPVLSGQPPARLRSQNRRADELGRDHHLDAPGSPLIITRNTAMRSITDLPPDDDSDSDVTGDPGGNPAGGQRPAGGGRSSGGGAGGGGAGVSLPERSGSNSGDMVRLLSKSLSSRGDSAATLSTGNMRSTDEVPLLLPAGISQATLTNSSIAVVDMLPPSRSRPHAAATNRGSHPSGSTADRPSEAWPESPGTAAGRSDASPHSFADPLVASPDAMHVRRRCMTAMPRLSDAKIKVDLDDDQATSDQDKEAGTPPLRAMIVEDNAVNRKLLVKLLSKLPRQLKRPSVQTLAAADGLEGYNMYCDAVENGRGLDIILMDIHMPVKSGLESTEMIRAYERKRGLPRVPISAVTAGVLTEQREECFAAGMDEFLSKPLTSQQLTKVICKLAPAPK
jgi:CheY-like chemotaxis protein